MCALGLYLVRWELVLLHKFFKRVHLVSVIMNCVNLINLDVGSVEGLLNNIVIISWLLCACQLGKDACLCIPLSRDVGQIEGVE